MKNIYVVMLVLFFSTIHTYADEIIIDGCTVYFSNLNNEQKDKIIELREELLLKSNEIKGQLKNIRIRIQQEMRKENPDWAYMDELNKRFFALQNQLTGELIKYKNQLENISYQNYNENGQLKSAD